MADKDLFLKNYSFYGKHCDMVNSLTQKIDNASNSAIFNKTIDLFIMSALIGVRNNHKSKPSIDKTRHTNILAEQFNSHNLEIKMSFKLVTLLGNSLEFNETERLNRTFRNPERDEIYTQYEEYMLGGLEDIYNTFILDSNNRIEDYLGSLNSFLDEFKKIEEDYHDVPDSDNLFD